MSGHQHSIMRGASVRFATKHCERVEVSYYQCSVVRGWSVLLSTYHCERVGVFGYQHSIVTWWRCSVNNITLRKGEGVLLVT